MSLEGTSLLSTFHWPELRHTPAPLQTQRTWEIEAEAKRMKKRRRINHAGVGTSSGCGHNSREREGRRESQKVKQTNGHDAERD